MTRSLAAPLAPEFEPFLFAAIGAERNGSPLSVLSALARSDVDPWQEAARLTALPEAAATRSLLALLAARPHSAGADTVARATAARLIALLPRRAGGASPARRWLARDGTALAPPVEAFIVLMLIGMACALGLEAVTATQRPPQQIGATQLPARGATLAGSRPRNSGGQ